jgi:hypothetical protein
MNYNSALKWLILPIVLLTFIATQAGLSPAEGQPYSLTNFRGEEVTIHARGLYFWDTVSSVAQMQANDLVTLVLGLPLLAISFWLTLRGSLRGRLLLTGTLGFVLYTYITMCFGAAYNKLFLVYVALFSLSLFAFILSMMSFDLKTLPAQFIGTPAGIVVASILFGLAHFSPGPGLIVLTDIGLIVISSLLYGVLFARRNNLWVVWLAYLLGDIFGPLILATV